VERKIWIVLHVSLLPFPQDQWST